MSLREGEDFYVENGLYVFTAAYLRRRGYCCGSGCRHCPYRPRHGGGRELADEPNPAEPNPPSPFPTREGGA